MKILFSDTHAFEKTAFDQVLKNTHFEISYLDFRITPHTAGAIDHADALISFVSDQLNRDCLKILKSRGVRLIATRSAGFNHIDVPAARELGIMVCRVPGYSPHAVAEFAVGLLLTLNRKIYRAYNRVRELNFSLDGLVGFDLHGKTIGIVGAGRIGKIFARIMLSFGCRILISDSYRDSELERLSNCSYASFETLCREADVISLHVPLTKDTFHLINEASLSKMKKGVLLINTGRGALIDTKSLIAALKDHIVGGAALDVYEEEEEVFFHDLSETGVQDDQLARLLTFPNVLVTSHQAFLTEEALGNIARTTLESIQEFSKLGTVPIQNRVTLT